MALKSDKRNFPPEEGPCRAENCFVYHFLAQHWSALLGLLWLVLLFLIQNIGSDVYYTF